MYVVSVTQPAMSGTGKQKQQRQHVPGIKDKHRLTWYLPLCSFVWAGVTIELPTLQFSSVQFSSRWYLCRFSHQSVCSVVVSLDSTKLSMFKSHLKTFLFAEAFQQILVLCLKKGGLYIRAPQNFPVCRSYSADFSPFSEKKKEKKSGLYTRV